MPESWTCKISLSFILIIFAEGHIINSPFVTIVPLYTLVVWCMVKWSWYRFADFTRSKQLSPCSIKEDIWSVPQCTMLLCYSGSTSHNAQCFYDDHDQFSQFSPHCRIHVHSSIILKDTVWITEFSWFSSLFGIFKALLSLDNLNR